MSAAGTDNSRAAHDRASLLNVLAFEQAERLAEGAKQAAFATAAAELRALGEHKTGADFDRHNQAVHRAEVAYLQAPVAAAEKYGVIGDWKTTLAHLPPVISSATWAAGRGKW